MELGKIYKKNNETSYCLGGSLTYELLISRPKDVAHIYFHPDFSGSEKKDDFIVLCRQNHIHYSENEKIFRRLADKEKCTVIGEFIKFEETIEPNKNHLVLVNPGNMGNMGTIIRTAVAFGIKDIAIIRPGVDIFDPKVIRASMGAFFHVRIQYFNSFEEYHHLSQDHSIYCFRLNASKVLKEVEITEPYSLVFGNESTGLDTQYDEIGQGVFIPITADVDSLSLPMAVGIALYEFTQKG